MVAAPQTGEFVFMGLKTKRKRIIHAYFSDVANAQVNLNSGAGASATSDTRITAPEDLYLVDMLIHTGMTDTTNVVPTINQTMIKNFRLRYANQLDTSGNGRPHVNMFVPAGAQFGAVQQ